jgi:hypothetical protein
MWGRLLVSLVLSALLAGCSPDYNWRTVSLAGGAVSSILPDKPITKSRTLEFAGHNITLTFLLAEVDGTLFAVGYAPLPDSLRADAALRAEMGRQVIESFYQGLKLPAPPTLPGFGQPFALKGPDTGRPTALHATVWMTPQALVEAMVTGDAAKFPAHEARQFLDSTKVR